LITLFSPRPTRDIDITKEQSAHKNKGSRVFTASAGLIFTHHRECLRPLRVGIPNTDAKLSEVSAASCPGNLRPECDE